MFVRTADAVWDGGFKKGRGRMRTAICEGDYTAGSRFGNDRGTNPEEMIGAAHAGCFSQALALGLEQAGYPPEHIETTARVHLDKVGNGFAITGIELVTKARVPNIAEAAFLGEAENAKQNCPVSQALQAVPISLQATLLPQ